ncbi:AmmeMemoRadiSam system protein B [Candidatus Falkowbacteria bacterium CG10_big_fil_rev_8_21_14_0_10_37_18]|uniref:AmmeMemoRadiSam system protein B n=1 Tax=Candidatus Falkowbacteria bacterium CG10_big_fil_rev_8_21_14_0_10_37_18 TaxID=1974562 RepID=A0A2H0V8J8_9BACT|nr:MAG: AmmeMemoRadiSam system protein B [Candidatus Falkowbacteria bacterium CG10_big_fil_rev_8_21_14_0_10_37_18]
MKPKKIAITVATLLALLAILILVFFRINFKEAKISETNNANGVNETHELNINLLLNQAVGTQYSDTSLFLSAIKQDKTEPSGKIISGLIIPHHLLAKDIIAATFTYASRGDYQNIVLLSPDHFDAGQKEISVTERDFSTVFGTIMTDKEIARQLKELSFVGEGDFFYREHGLGAQLPFIKYYFPQTKIIAITFKPTTSRDKLDQVIAILEKTLAPNSLIIQSTDFSHYLTPTKAVLEDTESINMIKSDDSGEALDLGQPANIDSTAALYIQASLQKNFFKNKPIILEHKNSQDYTTEEVLSSTSYIAVAYQANIEVADNANTPTETSGKANFIFVGDIMLSRYIGDLMAKKKNYDFPYEKIKNELADADLVFGNLETPVSNKGESAHTLYSFRADPLVLSGLKNSGFKVVSVANNHAFDYKLEAFTDTLSNLENAGIAYTGGGDDFNEAHNGATLEVNGIKTTILAYTDLLPKSAAATDNQAGIAYFDEAQMIKDIKTAKEKSDLVIVSFHWGQEYQTKSNAHQQKIATAAVTAGADLIVGHHPHVAQEVSEIQGVSVAYSLGNFIFDQNFSPETKNALMLDVKIENKKIVQVEPRTIKFTNSYQPYLE